MQKKKNEQRMSAVRGEPFQASVQIYMYQGHRALHSAVRLASTLIGETPDF